MKSKVRLLLVRNMEHSITRMPLPHIALMSNESSHILIFLILFTAHTAITIKTRTFESPKMMMINSKFVRVQGVLMSLLPSLFGSDLLPRIVVDATTSPPKTTNPPEILVLKTYGPFRACAEEQTVVGVTVMDETGNQLSGISVELFFDISKNLGSTVTDSYGFAAFYFQAPNAGTYSLTFEAFNKYDEVFSASSQLFSRECNSPGLVLETESVVNACVNKETSLVVAVTDTDGSPVENLEVTLHFQSGEYNDVVFSKVTNPNGFASVSLIPSSVFTSPFKFCAVNIDGKPFCSESSELVTNWCHRPDCSCPKPSKGILWPPNHELQDITIQGVTDSDGDDLIIEITSIFSDEKTPTAKRARGATKSPDASGLGTSTAQVRAERSGVPPHNGRVYTIAFKATNEKGEICTGTVKVGVPHKKKDTPVDDGAKYDATILRTRI